MLFNITYNIITYNNLQYYTILNVFKCVISNIFKYVNQVSLEITLKYILILSI